MMITDVMAEARIVSPPSNAELQHSLDRYSFDILKRPLLVLLMDIFGKEMEKQKQR